MVNEVLRIQVVNAGPGWAQINIRLRGESQWMYFEGLRVQMDNNVIIYDSCQAGLKGDVDLPWVKYSEVPREYDFLIEEEQ